MRNVKPEYEHSQKRHHWYQDPFKPTATAISTLRVIIGQETYSPSVLPLPAEVPLFLPQMLVRIQSRT